MLVALGSCACGWLDINPNLGIDEDEVFGSFRNIRKYFDYTMSTYDFQMLDNMYMGSTIEEESSSQKYTLDGTTDIADMGLIGKNMEYKQCNLSWETVNGRNISNKPISQAMWTTIRIANRTIEHLPDIPDCTDRERDETFGYAYFLRGFCHFVLCRRFGGVPYLDHSLGPDDEWDLTRLSNWETYQKCAEDFYTAYTYLERAGWMRRDGLPGESGHLTSPTAEYPSGISALAFRARALVYAASPLSNQNGIKDWEQAAEACRDALKACEEWKFSLVPFSLYSTLFLAAGETEETIWGHSLKCKDNSNYCRGLFTYPQSYKAGASGVCPTQNFVDLYETRWGDPLDTEEARAYAQSIGHYNPQDPYSNLDPRFEEVIVHDGSKNKFVTGTINIYKSTTGKWPVTYISGTTAQFGVEWGTTDQESNGYSVTGYYCKKYWEGQRGDKGASHGHMDNLFRLAEVYLNYAEAVNEAYGPAGKAPGCELSALDAVNIIRTRAGMPDVQDRFTGSKDALRARIQNERMVEFAFEGAHYYYDIRRWKTAPQRMGNKMYGMYVTKVTKNSTYPNGRMYERRLLPETRQCTWKDSMYYFPFAQEQVQTMFNFKNNELWH